MANIITTLQNTSEVANGITLMTNSEEFMDAPFGLMNFYITGTSTTREVQFEIVDFDGNYYPIKCANLSTLAIASSTTGINEAWQVNLACIDGFRAKVTAIDGGTVVIKGELKK